MKLTHKLILTLALSILITACYDDEKTSTISKSKHQDSSIEKQVSKAPEVKPMADNVTMTSKVTPTEDNRAIVSGKTNLPDGTQLLIILSNDGRGFSASSKAVVTESEFTSLPLGPPSGLDEGNYEIDIVMSSPRMQPENVKAIVGEMGEHLSGELVVKDETFGDSVEQQLVYQVGTEEAIKETVKKDLETASNIKQSLERLLATGRSMEKFRTDDTVSSLRKCGALMKENQPKAEALNKQADELPMSYLQLKVAAADIYMCVSCLESSASAACDRVTESIKDF